MYSVDLNNIVPKGGLTCLFAKATSDESKLWHRRLAQLSFKTLNKLVKENLVRGLPSKFLKIIKTMLHVKRENNTEPLVKLERRQHLSKIISQDDGFKSSSDDGKKVDEDLRQESECKDQEKENNVNSTNNVNAASTNEVNDVRKNITNIELPFDPEMPALEDISTFNLSSDHEDDDEIADINNLDTTI
uniref:Ribonuclease H-like domain-containing protein n=1 Tax=Tanacetum cinerariifolium TaxID=118510 RepID=A0A699IBJ4_TANCI|nr:ribonuclease H-like domain-containing protein [Tanacetum cinerariifolium]